MNLHLTVLAILYLVWVIYYVGIMLMMKHDVKRAIRLIFYNSREITDETVEDISELIVR